MATVWMHVVSFPLINLEWVERLKTNIVQMCWTRPCMGSHVCCRHGKLITIKRCKFAYKFMKTSIKLTRQEERHIDI